MNLVEQSCKISENAHTEIPTSDSYSCDSNAFSSSLSASQRPRSFRRIFHHHRTATPFACQVALGVTTDAAYTTVAISVNDSETDVTQSVSAEDASSFTCKEEPPIYVSGGYIPLHLGQKIKSTISGTEWDADSNVWPTYTESKGYTAIKILTCIASSRAFECKGYVFEILKRLRYRIHAGTAHEGNQQCIDASEVHIPFKGFPLSAIKNLGWQVLLALSCLHSLGSFTQGFNVFMCMNDNQQQAIADFLQDKSVPQRRMNPASNRRFLRILLLPSAQNLFPWSLRRSR
ncbi:hypothetical protein K439DRAFT_1623278 [Ramaria rubella]|nr:hypothetical protein K439DRAFT_1623278 [Ramaria rubella]